LHEKTAALVETHAIQQACGLFESQMIHQLRDL
jgi:hypothetical protein